MRRWYLTTSSSYAFWSPATVRSTSIASLSVAFSTCKGGRSALMDILAWYLSRAHRPRYCHSRRDVQLQKIVRRWCGGQLVRRVNRTAQIQPALGHGAPLYPSPQPPMGLVFKPEQQRMLEIANN